MSDGGREPVCLVEEENLCVWWRKRTCVSGGGREPVCLVGEEL